MYGDQKMHGGRDAPIHTLREEVCMAQVANWTHASYTEQTKVCIATKWTRESKTSKYTEQRKLCMGSTYNRHRLPTHWRTQ